ncbi:MAG: hypothetical protein EOO38_23000 [Cytophagaceae bacterium]|nr:MAG: hypothetical protein EOO38_23000 [Cytophagaceae bacterium]
MSWVAYVRPIVVFGVMAILAIIVSTFSQSLGVIAALAALGLLVYRVLYFRSVRLFTNDEGVWLFRGILPWNNGIIGVKWRDVEDAVYFTGFVSWAFNAHAVRIGHRFTKTSELTIANMKDGIAAVNHINEIHRIKIGDLPS